MNANDLSGEKVLTGYTAMVESLHRGRLQNIAVNSFKDWCAVDQRSTGARRASSDYRIWGPLPIATPSGLRAWAWRRARKSAQLPQTNQEAISV